MDAAARRWLVGIARDVLAQDAAGGLRVAPATMTLPASTYTSRERFEAEQRQLFRRVPLMLAASCELREPGAFKTLEVAGVPVLLTRDREGTAHALLNACTHRGAPVASGCGRASRFTCPYHGWSFGNDGRLAGIASAADFGAIDKAAYALRRLPLRERNGLLWVVLDPASTLDVDGFLGDFGNALDGFGFAGWRMVEQRTLRGANWKLAFDAHLEFYHLPVLHKATFGPGTDNRALYFHDGPHARLIRPVGGARPDVAATTSLAHWRDAADDAIPTEALLLGEWILFPNVSINSFDAGGRSVLISQVFPGATVDESFTVQSFYMQHEPDEEALAAARGMAAFLEHVVRDEDLANSFAQQRALASGLLETVCIGRNEGGLQHFHRWLEAILGTEDAALDALFERR